MNWIDIIVMGFIALGAFMGFRKGFIQSLAGLVAVGLAVWIGLNFSGLLESSVAQYDVIPVGMIKLVSLLLTIFLAYLAIKLAAKALHTIVHTVGLGIVNRLVGSVLGVLLKVVALAAIVYYLNPMISAIFEPETIETSEALPYLNEVVEFLKVNLETI